MHQLSHSVTARIAVVTIALLCQTGIAMGAENDRAVVAALDTNYQAAIKRNDLGVVERTLGDDFVLVSGAGQVTTREQLIAEVRKASVHYEQQDEVAGTQTVRVWGDTAVVTALLWLKGHDGDQAFDRKLWFSDVYVRTPAGWKYVLGQVGRVVERDGKPVPP